MHKITKQLSSLSFLLLFLFPLVEKQLHAMEHADDIHCNATDKHFHEAEHSCSICDYTFSDTPSELKAEYSFFLSTINFEYIGFHPILNSGSETLLLPSRAPPIC
jgi:hypothetical protein